MNTLEITKELSNIQITSEKTCNCCGKEHSWVSENFMESMGLYWWNCECGSTLVIETTSTKETNR